MPSPISIEERRRQSAEAYRMAGLPPIGGGSPENDPPTPPPVNDPPADPPEDKDPEGLNDAGKAALKAERQKARDAEKAWKAGQAELEQLRKEKADAAAAKALADEEEAKRKGEFEELATKRAEELKTVASERDDYKSQLDNALTLIGAGIDEDWKSAPAAVIKLYRGDKNDVLAKRQHLTDHADIIAALNNKQDEAKKAAGFGRTPTPQGTKQEDKGLVGSVRF